MPYRARAIVLEDGALRVLERAVDGVGDPAVETSDGFERPLAFGPRVSVVDAVVGVQADLADRGDVDHVVHPPIPGPRESVPGLLAGGGFQVCGAGPGREPVAVGEAGHVADVGQDSSSNHGADAGDVHQP